MIRFSREAFPYICQIIKLPYRCHVIKLVVVSILGEGQGLFYLAQAVFYVLSECNIHVRTYILDLLGLCNCCCSSFGNGSSPATTVHF